MLVAHDFGQHKPYETYLPVRKTEKVGVPTVLFLLILRKFLVGHYVVAYDRLFFCQAGQYFIKNCLVMIKVLRDALVGLVN